jgi:hypothetical protein
MVGINYVLNMAWSIVNKSAGVDDKTRLQALALINDCNKYKIDLTANGVIVTDAIRCSRSNGPPKQDRESITLLQDIKQKEGKEEQQEEDIGQQKTHNGIL